ncbi:hypothetical protein D3C80_725630 [compost metagenome]
MAPRRGLDRAVQAAGQDAAVRAVAVHHIEAGVVIAHPLIIIADIGDAATVGRDDGRLVRASAVGQGGQDAGAGVQGIDFAVGGLALPVGAAIGAEIEGGGIGRPGQIAAVVEVALGQLARPAAVGGGDEDLTIARLQIALAVSAIGDGVDDLQRRRPLGAFRLGQGRAQAGGLAGDQNRIGQLGPVRRPADSRGRVGQAGDAHGLARGDPAHEQLGAAALGCRDIGDARAVRGPARLAVGPGGGDQRRLLARARVDQPDRRPHPVGHDVGGLAHIGDARSIRADLRVRSHFEAEQVLGLETGGFGRKRRRLRHGRRGQQGQGAAGPDGFRHSAFPPLERRDHRYDEGGGKPDRCGDG